MIVETGKSEMCRAGQQARNSGRNLGGSLETKCLLFQLSLLRPFN